MICAWMAMFGAWGGGGCLDWHCLNCDLGGFGWGVISLMGCDLLCCARCQVGKGVLSGLDCDFGIWGDGL